MKTLYELIEQRHPPNEWAVFSELASSTGTIQTRLDAAAFNCWRSKKLFRVAYEFKASRGDFLAELRRPAKREFAEAYFHETYFVFEKAEIGKADEIPDGWGLLVRTKKGDQLRRQKVARHREPAPIGTNMMISVLRRAAHTVNAHKYRSFEFEGDEITLEELQAKVNKILVHDQKVLFEQQTATAAERDKLRRDRHALRAPMKRLVELSHEQHWGHDALIDEVTPQLVDHWFEMAKQHAARMIFKQIKQACGQVNSALHQLRSLQDLAAEDLSKDP